MYRVPRSASLRRRRTTPPKRTAKPALDALGVNELRAFDREVSHPLQEPPPPPLEPDKQVLRRVTVENRGFRDWLGPLDARIYRFRL